MALRAETNAFFPRLQQGRAGGYVGLWGALVGSGRPPADHPHSSYKYGTVATIARAGLIWTRINSAGALLAFRLLFDVFPQFIRG